MDFDKNDISPEGLEKKLEDQWVLLGEYRTIFESIDRRFAEVVKRFYKFDEVEATFVALKGDVAAISAGVADGHIFSKRIYGELKSKIDDLEKSVKRLVENIGNLPAKMVEMQGKVSSLEGGRVGILTDIVRIDREATFQKTATSLRLDELFSSIDTFQKRITTELKTLETTTLDKFEETQNAVKAMVADSKIQDLKAKQSRTADDVESMSQRLSIIEKNVDVMTRQLAKLDLTLRALKVGV
jgi:archaellum component FlaC